MPTKMNINQVKINAIATLSLTMCLALTLGLFGTSADALAAAKKKVAQKTTVSTVQNQLNLTAAAKKAGLAAKYGTGYADLIHTVSPAAVSVFVESSPESNISQENLDALQAMSPEARELFMQAFSKATDEDSNIGSGFIIDEKGLIVTSYHVVVGANSITVMDHSGVTYDASIVASDEKTDIALIQIKTQAESDVDKLINSEDKDEDKDGVKGGMKKSNGGSQASQKFPYVQFGDSDKARVGDFIFSIGNEFGFGETADVGIISATNRLFSEMETTPMIQTNILTGSGNSGGALFNTSGEVVGMSFAFVSDGTGSNLGASVAVSSNTVKNVVSVLQKKGKFVRGELGVSYYVVDKEMSKTLNLPSSKGSAPAYGAFITGVKDGSAASKVDIMVGDVICSVNGKQLLPRQPLSVLIGNIEAGSKVSLSIFRDGKMITINPVLKMPKPAEKPANKLIDAKSDKKAEVSLPSDSVNKSENKESATAVKSESADKSADKSTDKAAGKFETKTEIGVVIIPISPEVRKEYKISDDLPNGVIVSSIENDVIKNDDVLKVGDVVVEIDGAPITTAEDFNNAMVKLKESQKKFSMIRMDRRNTILLEPVQIFE